MAQLAVLNATGNNLSHTTLSSLPASLQVVYLAHNSFTGTLPMPNMLPNNLTVLDVSNNLLTGTLPQTLAGNLTVFNASGNHLTGTLPSIWPRLAGLQLDNANLIGGLPTQWSDWGKNTSNSIQLSIVGAKLHGSMPQEWVKQFCLAVVEKSSEQVLFAPTSLDIQLAFGDIAHKEATQDVIVPIGSPITLISQHASINVTLKGKLYSFSYEDPGSVCSIPHAIRNVAIFWGVFAGVLLAVVVGLYVWLRHKKSNAQNMSANKFTALSFRAQHNQKVMTPKRVFTLLWAFFSDVAWFLYSQVTDLITIHQVFESGHWGYAVVLLIILLLPYLLVFLLVVRVCVRYLQSRAGNPTQTGMRRCLNTAAAYAVGFALSPLVFLALELGMMADAVKFPISRWVSSAFCDLSTLYRAKSIAESFLNALPQAIIQTKLYIMGNDPSGIHVYIDTRLYSASIFGSLTSIWKTVALLMVEVDRYGYGIIRYLKRLLDVAPFDNYVGFPSHACSSSNTIRSQHYTMAGALCV